MINKESEASFTLSVFTYLQRNLTSYRHLVHQMKFIFEMNHLSFFLPSFQFCLLFYEKICISLWLCASFMSIFIFLFFHSQVLREHIPNRYNLSHDFQYFWYLHFNFIESTFSIDFVIASSERVLQLVQLLLNVRNMSGKTRGLAIVE